MDKLKMHSPNLTEANIAKLAELFPSCVTEARDEQGQVKQAIDFDHLRQELSDHIVEGPQERYLLNWPGKKEALVASNTPITKTLRPINSKSINFENTKNIFIEGDNLEAMKLLQKSYLGKVKLVYFDPPYNTGSDLVYRDNFSGLLDDYKLSSSEIDEVGNRLTTNSTSNGRFHSDWLSMIYPRLRLSRNLLRDDGVILISIDDNELCNLCKVMDEVFGAENFVSVFLWRRRQRADNRNFSRASHDHEYVVAYSKSSNFKFKGVNIDSSKYKNPDDDPRGPWASVDLSGLATASRRPNLHFNIVDPDTGNDFPPNPNRGWSKSKSTIEKMILEGRILFPSSSTGRPREKKFLRELNSTVTGFSSWLDSKEVGFTTNGTREVAKTLGSKVFDFPKPVDLVKKFVMQCTQDDDLVLDGFCGSATAAVAVSQSNLEDGGDRKFILVQMPEKLPQEGDDGVAGFSTISELAVERYRRFSDSLSGVDGDFGLRFFEIDSSSMRDVFYSPGRINQDLLPNHVDNVKDGRQGADLLFQVMLDWGVDLSLPISRQEVDEKTVFFVDGDEKHMALAACFDLEIDEAFVKQLAEYEPLRVVYRDAGFASDSVKINVEQIFSQKSPNTEVKVI